MAQLYLSLIQNVASNSWSAWIFCSLAQLAWPLKVRHCSITMHQCTLLFSLLLDSNVFLSFWRVSSIFLCVLHTNQMSLTKQKSLPGERGRKCVEIFSQMDKSDFLYWSQQQRGEFILMALEPQQRVNSWS